MVVAGCDGEVLQGGRGQGVHRRRRGLRRREVSLRGDEERPDLHRAHLKVISFP